jgi:hypothetical protein
LIRCCCTRARGTFFVRLRAHGAAGERRRRHAAAGAGNSHGSRWACAARAGSGAAGGGRGVRRLRLQRDEQLQGAFNSLDAHGGECVSGATPRPFTALITRLGSPYSTHKTQPASNAKNAAAQDYRAGFRKEHTISSEKSRGAHGPLRANTTIRGTFIMDYKPDICKVRGADTNTDRTLIASQTSCVRLLFTVAMFAVHRTTRRRGIAALATHASSCTTAVTTSPAGS